MPFVELDGVRASQRPLGEARLLLTTAAMYRALVGAEPPADVDFRRTWVVYYGAGTRPTGGYEAHIADIRRSPDGRTLTITTRLVQPGTGCFVTQALTHPYVLARLPSQEGTPRVLFEHQDDVRECAQMPSTP